MPDHIKTDHLVLRPFDTADADRVVEILGNYEVSKWLARVPHPFTHTDLKLLNDDGSSRWPGLAAITHEGRLVGGMSIKPDRFGYWIAPDDHGRGFATEAGGGAMAYLFEETDAESVISGYFEGNIGSARVLEKLGFVEQDRYPHACVARGHDMPNVDMVLTRAAWHAKTEAVA